MIVAFLALALGVIADLIRINRILIEDSLEQQKRERVRSRTGVTSAPGPVPARLVRYRSAQAEPEGRSA